MVAWITGSCHQGGKGCMGQTHQIESFWGPGKCFPPSTSACNIQALAKRACQWQRCNLGMGVWSQGGHR